MLEVTNARNDGVRRIGVVTGPSGMNAIAHCVEALYAQDSNPITSLLAEEGIRAFARSLATAIREPDNLQARADTEPSRDDLA